MKRVLSIFLLCGIALTLSATPARRGWSLRTLADGTTMELQLSGDEYYHYLQTRDGRLVRETEAGLVLSDEPVPAPEQMAQRRAASPLYRDNLRRVGTRNLAPRGLLILAAFSDVPFRQENTKAAIDSMMNLSGYDYSYTYGGRTYTATGSARDYFIAQSDSQYMPVFDVVGPVTLPQPVAYYGTNTNGDGTDIRKQQLAVDACKAADEIADFSRYDNNNDGVVDFVYVLFSGMGEADGGASQTVWPHNSNMPYHKLQLDGKWLYSYACSGEINGFTDNRTGIGTICHEFGHVLGLPDYYDIYYKDNYDHCLTPNAWSVMDQGTYCNEGLTPPNYSVYDKYWMGWATPEILAAESRQDVALTTAYDDAYQITGGATLLPYTDTHTIYYIENRQKKGWDAYIPGHGMLVWKVQYNQSRWSGNTVNTTADAPLLTVLSANGGTIGAMPGVVNVGDGAGGYITDDDNPFPGSAGVQTFTPFDGCALTDITEQDGVVTFKFNGGAPEDPTTVEQLFLPDTRAKGRKLLENGQLLILRGNKRFNAQGIEIQ